MGDILYRSNNGNGPYLARVLAVVAGQMLMVRWHRDLELTFAEGVMFEMPAKFLDSPACGWEAVGDAPELEPVRKAIAERWATRQASATPAAKC